MLVWLVVEVLGLYMHKRLTDRPTTHHNPLINQLYYQTNNTTHEIRTAVGTPSCSSSRFSSPTPLRSSSPGRRRMRRACGPDRTIVFCDFVGQ